MSIVPSEFVQASQLVLPALERDERPCRRRWTRDEYYRLAEAGMFEGQRVELIAGEILLMSPLNHPHATALTLGDRVLSAAFGPGFFVRNQLPFKAALDCEPEPDLAVILGDPRDLKDHPASALLLVEISDTTLAYDRREKASLYALSNVPEYWVVNIAERQLEVHRRPQPDGSPPFGHGYAERIVVPATGGIAPLSLPDKTIAVADLLP